MALPQRQDPDELRREYEMDRQLRRSRAGSRIGWWWLWLIIICLAIWWAGWGWGGTGGWWWGHRGSAYGTTINGPGAAHGVNGGTAHGRAGSAGGGR